jgi:hypothetical protein
MRLWWSDNHSHTVNPTTLALYELAAADEVARANRIAQRWRIYHGQHPRSLKVRQGQLDDNVTVNFARVIVDKGVSFLFGQDLRFELDETAETEAEQWLSACWGANRQMTTLAKLALNGAIAGHAFVKIIPQQGSPYPRLVVLDPATVAVRWEPDDIEQVTRYTISYPALDPGSGKPVRIRQIIERDGPVWVITDQRSAADSATWQTVGEARWPYAWPPIVDCQNLPCPNEYWGLSDLEDDLLQLNAAINFVLSNLARIIRFHAHPKTWGKGFAANQLNIAVDETIVLPSPDASLHNLEMQSDLASSITVYQRLREALHEVARVPEVATGKLDNVGSLSGVALQILYQPLLEKTQTKRRTYGDLLMELNRRLLQLGGFGDDNQTVIHWPELLPADPLVVRQAALLDQQLGVSADTVLQKLGYNPDLERAKREAASAQLGEQLLAAFERGQ